MIRYDTIQYSRRPCRAPCVRECPFAVCRLSSLVCRSLPSPSATIYTTVLYGYRDLVTSLLWLGGWRAGGLAGWLAGSSFGLPGGRTVILAGRRLIQYSTVRVKFRVFLLLLRAGTCGGCAGERQKIKVILSGFLGLQWKNLNLTEMRSRQIQFPVLSFSQPGMPCFAFSL